MSVLQILAQERVKAPCEKSFLIHLQWLRQLVVDKLVLIGWTDTRDQYADGLTKGAVSCELLQEVAKGTCENRHAITWIHQVKVKDADASVGAGCSDPLAQVVSLATCLVAVWDHSLERVY